jgi:hypothetical protein
MGTLKEANPSAYELLTETLDKALWWNVLSLIAEFLRTKQVEEVHIEFGFVLKRNLEGKPQVPEQFVNLADLEATIRKGFDEGTIEWAQSSDFVFRPVGIDLAFMLCNDADLHLASADRDLFMELGRKVRSSGVRVYDSGRLI